MDHSLQPLLASKSQDVYAVHATQTVYEAVAEMDAKNVHRDSDTSCRCSTVNWLRST